MPLTLAEQANLADDIEFQRRVRQSIVKYAITVRQETTATDPRFQARHRLAIESLADPVGATPRIARAVATTANDASITDAQIDTAVKNNWNALSSYIASPPPAPESGA